MAENPLQTAINNNFESSPVTAKSNRTPVPDTNITQNPNTGSLYYDPRTSSSFIDPRTFGSNTQIGRDIYNDRYYDRYNKAILNPFASDYFDTKIWGINIGSVTDLHSNPDRRVSVNLYSNAIDFEHLRRNEQSGFSAGINLVNQFVGKTLVNGVGGIIAGFYGIGSAIANWDIDKLADNSVARGFDSASEWIDENNSVFTSQRGRDNGYFGMFSYDTLKDFNDGLSFVSGIVLSEGIMGLASGGASLTTLPGRIGNMARRGAILMDRVAEATKASIGVNSTIKNTGGLYKRVDEINKAIKAADRAGLEQLALNLNTTVDDLARYRRALDNFDSTIRGGRQLITSTFYEGGLEARHFKDEFLNNAMEKLEEEVALRSFNSEEEKEAYRQAKIKEFNEMADVGAFGTFALNAVLLRASNVIQFPSIFGSKALSSMNKNSSKFTRESLGKVIQNNNKAGRYFSTVGSILKAPLTEFMEETGQGFISNFFDNYYESYLGLETAYPELTESNSKFGDAFVKALSDTYGTRDGLYEGVLGALLGATGAPTIMRNSKGKIRPKMAGGIYESVRDFRKNQKLLDDIENNTIEYGTILGYNRDNAILAAITGKKKDLAGIFQDFNLAEEIDNNTIYTYVKDRLDKGLKDIMDQDVEEILSLDLDTYKAKFNRPDSFTKEDMQEEKNNFKAKVDSYTKAYEKVMEGLQMDRINNNPMTKKYFDILTYAVANEQIYTDAYNKAVQEILDNPNNKFTKEQIEIISKHTSLFKGKEKELLDYIEARREEKLKKLGKPLERIKNKLETAKSKLEEVSGSKELLKLFTEEIFDTDGNISKKAKEDIEIIKKINKNNPNLFRELDLLEEVQTLQDIYNDVNKEFQARAKSLKINPKRTAEGREKIKNVEEILEELNERINKEKGEALNILRGKKDKVLLKDLEEYFELSSQREEMIENSTPTSMLDVLDSKQGKSLRELYDRIGYITKERTMAVEIAHSLYSDGQVSKGLARLINASLNKNKAKLELYNAFVESTLNSSIADDALGTLSIEFSNIIEKNKKLLEEYRNNLNEEFAKEYEELIKKAESNLEKLNKIIEVNDKEEDSVKSQLEEQQKRQNKQEEKSLENIVKKEEKDQELEKKVEDNDLDIQKEIISGNKPEFDNSSPKIGKKNMTYTINQVPDSTQPEFKAFSDAIEDGTIQYNQGVTLELELSQEENDSFWEYIDSVGKREDYLSGKDKVLANPELLKEKPNLLDPDVKFFIAVAPIRLKVHPNQVEIGLENKQDFEISESDDLPSILLPNGMFDYELKLDAKYEARLKAIEEQFEQNKKKAEINSKIKVKGSNTSSDIEAQKADIERRRQEELLIPQSLDKLPDYLAEGIKKSVEQLPINQRYEIVKQAILGKTAQQIVSELNLIGTDGKRNTEIVRQVRAYYGIPSQDTEGYQEWKNKVDKINAKYDAEIAALEGTATSSEIEITDKQELDRLLKLAQFNYIKQLEELNAEIASVDSKSNDKVNFFLRATVLYNQLGIEDATPTKARVGNFVNGSIKKPELTIEQSNNKLVVTADNVNGFVQDVEELSTKIVYGTQSGILHDINHDPVRLKEGSLVEAQYYQTGAIYYIHTTSNGQKIPILLNSAKLGDHPELVEELMDIMREYLKDPKPDDIVQLKSNSILKFLDNRFKYKEFFNLFLMPSRSGSSAIALNTFNIRANSQNSAIYGAIEFGDPQLSSIKFLTQEEFDNNIKLIRNALSNYRFHLDVNMLKDKDGIIDRQALEFVFERGLLTHHFNFASNPKEYKDYIFEPKRGGKENRRAVQIHLINTDSNSIDENKRNKKISSKEKIINLFRKNSDDKSNLSAANIVYNLNSKVVSTANSKISKYPKNKEFTPEIEKELILQAVEEEVNKLIDSINKIQTEPSASNRFTPDFESKLEEGVIFDLNKVDSSKWIDVAKAIVHNYKVITTNEKNYNTIKKLIANRNYPFVLRKLLLGIDNGRMSSFILPDIKELNGKKTFDLESNNNSDPNRKFKKEQINNMVTAMQLINEIANTFGPKLFNHSVYKKYKADNLHINFTSSYLNSGSPTGYTRDVNSFSIGKDDVTRTGLKKGQVGRNALQYLYFGTDNKIKGRESFEFYKYKDDKGNISYDERGRVILIKVENPKNEFTYNSDGTIEDGIIIMNTKNQKGNYNEVLLVYGTENTDIMEKRPSLRNIAERVQLPFFRNGEIIQEDYDAAIELLNNFKNNSEDEEKLVNKTKAKIVDLSEMEKEDKEEESEKEKRDLEEARAAFFAAVGIKKDIIAQQNNSNELNIDKNIDSSQSRIEFRPEPRIEFDPDKDIGSRAQFIPGVSDVDLEVLDSSDSESSDQKSSNSESSASDSESSDGKVLGLLGGKESFGPDADDLPTLKPASEEVQLNIPDGLIEAKKILFKSTRDKGGSNNATARSRVNFLLNNKTKEIYNKIYVEFDTLGELKSQAYNKEFMIEYFKNIGIDNKKIIEIINFVFDTKITEDDINRICK